MIRIRKPKNKPKGGIRVGPHGDDTANPKHVKIHSTKSEYILTSAALSKNVHETQKEHRALKRQKDDRKNPQHTIHI